MHDVHAEAIATVEAITAAESSTSADAYLSAEYPTPLHLGNGLIRTR